MGTVAKVAKLCDPTKGRVLRVPAHKRMEKEWEVGKPTEGEASGQTGRGFRNSVLMLAFTQVYQAFQFWFLQPLAFSKVWQKTKFSLSSKPTKEIKDFSYVCTVESETERQSGKCMKSPPFKSES